jgi:hypothetical protein
LKKLILLITLLSSFAFATTPVNVTKTVTTAGTEIQVSTGAQKPASIYFEALGTNTGYVYVGVAAVSSTAYIARLSAGQGFAIASDSGGNRVGGDLVLSDYWVDTSVNGEKVQVTYLYRTGP